VSQIDPTDHALATIASILDQSELSKEPQTAAPASPPPIPSPPPLPEPVAAVEPEPEVAMEAKSPEQPESFSEPVAAEPVAVPNESPLAPAAVEPIEAAGYSKVGPGPMAAIRFKWTVRRDDDGQFFVDETIGENSAPVVIGPMSSDEAIQMVDARESEARQRFEQIKAEMTGRAAAAGLVRSGGGEM
jgi:hypothetical protein